MLSNKKIANILLPAILIFLLGQTGCSQTPTASEILKRALSAMGNATSYQLDSNVIWPYTTIGGTAPGKSSIIWIGNTLADTANKALHKSMNIESTDLSGDKTHWTVENYLAADYAYVKANSDLGRSNTFNVWYKSKSSDEGWTGVNQIAELIGLMKTSNNSTLNGSEKTAGIDCYILDIQPSISAIADWVGTQFQGYGGIDYSTAPFLGGRDNYLKDFKSGSFKIWIAKDSSLVMKAIINPHFEATPQDLGVTAQTMEYSGFDKVTSDFQGELNFTKYNQPVSIQPPPDSIVTSR